MIDQGVHESIGSLLDALDSLTGSDRAVDELVRHGQRAVPFLADYLLDGKLKSVAVSRCRAAHALGELGAYSTLASYFQKYEKPDDSVLAFAEDAVRSVAAQELLRWNSPAAFEVLLAATKQRATAGLVLALGELRRVESIPVLFEILEDDICREQATSSLLKMPDATREYAILTIRGATTTDIKAVSSTRRKRATFQILKQIGIRSADWRDVSRFLWDEDPDVVIAAGQLGFVATEEHEWRRILMALFSAAFDFNCFQEDEFTELCDNHPEIARSIAMDIAKRHTGPGIRPNWASPLWRILNHILGGRLMEIGEREAGKLPRFPARSATP